MSCCGGSVLVKKLNKTFISYRVLERRHRISFKSQKKSMKTEV